MLSRFNFQFPSDFNFLSSRSSLSSHHSLLRLLFLAKLRVFFFLTSSFSVKIRSSFLPAFFFLFCSSFSSLPFHGQSGKGCSSASCSSSFFLLIPSNCAEERYLQLSSSMLSLMPQGLHSSHCLKPLFLSILPSTLCTRWYAFAIELHSR